MNRREDTADRRSRVLVRLRRGRVQAVVRLGLTALVVRLGLVALVVLAMVTTGAVAWTQVVSAGHRFAAEEAPIAPVVIVFGGQLAPGGAVPMPVLAGRLDVTARLFREGKARGVLVSGDGAGASGNETAAMTRYLVAAGVPAHRVVADPYGLDSYDTCARARTVFGVTRALLVTQEQFHLARAVTLCRSLGVDADGVAATCPGCRRSTIAKNAGRGWLACVKAVYDVALGRPPAVRSKPDSVLTEALQD